MKKLFVLKISILALALSAFLPQQSFAIGGGGVGVGLRSYRTNNIYGHTYGNSRFSKQIFGRKGFYFRPDPFRNSRAYGFQHDLRRSYNSMGSSIKGYSQKASRMKTDYPQFYAPPAGGSAGARF